MFWGPLAKSVGLVGRNLRNSLSWRKNQSVALTEFRMAPIVVLGGLGLPFPFERWSVSVGRRYRSITFRDLWHRWQWNITRSPDALRLLTLCNWDCKLVTYAICRGFHWYTMRCIHLVQRFISSRHLTDYIYEIETTGLAHVACFPQESGILVAVFAGAYSRSVQLQNLQGIHVQVRRKYLGRLTTSELKTRMLSDKHNNRCNVAANLKDVETDENTNWRPAIAVGWTTVELVFIVFSQLLVLSSSVVHSSLLWLHPLWIKVELCSSHSHRHVSCARWVTPFDLSIFFTSYLFILFIFLHSLLLFTFYLVVDYNHVHFRWGAGPPGQKELLHRRFNDWWTLLPPIPATVILGSLWLRRLNYLISSVISCEVLTATGSRTWNSREPLGANFFWPGV